ncbi:MAG: hypothetical protein QOG54_246 [Actinomycetota bacterium]|jgi:hypothetical protein|nr:hypothetical protein [Actinomycetota bacterium]
MKIAIAVITGTIGGVGLCIFLYGVYRAFRYGLNPRPGEQATLIGKSPGQTPMFRKVYRADKATGVGLSYGRMRELIASGEYRSDPSYRTFFLMIGGMLLAVLGAFATTALFLPAGQGLYMIGVVVLVFGLIAWQFRKAEPPS